MSTDAIVLLRDEHKQIRKVFADFEKAGETAHATREKLVDSMIELLTVHTYIENEVMYPRVRELLPDLEDDVLESYEEHGAAGPRRADDPGPRTRTTSAVPAERAEEDDRRGHQVTRSHTEERDS